MTMNIIQREAQYDKYTPEQLIQGMKRGGEDAGMMSMALMRRNKGAGGGMKMRGLGSPGMTGMPSGGMPAPPAQGFAAGGLAERKALYDPIFREAASGKNPYELLLQQAIWESGLKNDAVSSAGAGGVSQFMPATAKQYGVDVNDPRSSVFGQRAYMDDLHDMFGGNLEAKLAGYNAGQGNVQKAMKSAKSQDWNVWKNFLPMPEETIPYVEGIRSKMNMEDYQASGASLGSGGASAPGAGILGSVTELGENGGSIPGVAQEDNPLKQYMQMQMLQKAMAPKQQADSGIQKYAQNYMLDNTVGGFGFAEGGLAEMDEAFKMEHALMDKDYPLRRRNEDGDYAEAKHLPAREAVRIQKELQYIEQRIREKQAENNYARGGEVEYEETEEEKQQKKGAGIEAELAAMLAKEAEQSGRGSSFLAGLAGDRGISDALSRFPGAAAIPMDYGINPMYAQGGVVGFADAGQVTGDYGHYKRTLDRNEMDLWALKRAQKSHESYGTGSAETADRILDLEQVIERQRAESYFDSLNVDESGRTMDDYNMEQGIAQPGAGASGSWGEPTNDDRGVLDVPQDGGIMSGAIDIGNNAMSDAKNWGLDQLGAVSSSAEDMLNFGKVLFGQGEYQNNSPANPPAKTSPYPPLPPLQQNPAGDNMPVIADDPADLLDSTTGGGLPSAVTATVDNEVRGKDGVDVDPKTSKPVEADWTVEETEVKTAPTPTPTPIPASTGISGGISATAPMQFQGRQRAWDAAERNLAAERETTRRYEEIRNRPFGGRYAAGLAAMAPQKGLRTTGLAQLLAGLGGAGVYDSTSLKDEMGIRNAFFKTEGANIGRGSQQENVAINAMAGNKASNSNTLTRVASIRNSMEGAVTAAKATYDASALDADESGRKPAHVAAKWEVYQQKLKALDDYNRKANSLLGIPAPPPFKKQPMPGTGPAPTTAPGVTNIKRTN